MTRPMTEAEQEEHRQAATVVRSALSALRLSGLTDEDIEVAKARLDDWLRDNDGRWVVER